MIIHVIQDVHLFRNLFRRRGTLDEMTTTPTLPCSWEIANSISVDSLALAPDLFWLSRLLDQCKFHGVLYLLCPIRERHVWTVVGELVWKLELKMAALNIIISMYHCGHLALL